MVSMSSKAGSSLRWKPSRCSSIASPFRIFGATMVDRCALAGTLATVASLALGCHSNTSSAGNNSGDVTGHTDGGPVAGATSILELHGGPSRAGVYTQAGAAGGVPRLDPAFPAPADGVIPPPPPLRALGRPALVPAGPQTSQR